MNRCFKSVVISVFIIIGGSAHALTITFEEAVEKNRISYLFYGNGGIGHEAITLELTNRLSSDLNVIVNEGQQLSAKNDEVQNLLIMEDTVIHLMARESKSVTLYAACTNRSNLAPMTDEPYDWEGQAAGVLYEVSKKIAENEYYTSAAQNTVWAITNGTSIDHIYNKAHVDLSWDLMKLAAEYQKFELPKKEKYLPVVRSEPQKLYTARIDIHHMVPHSDTLSLYAVNQNGDTIKTYFQNKSYSSGLQVFTIGFNGFVDSTDVYEAMLVRNGLLLQKKPLLMMSDYKPFEEELLNIRTSYIVRKAGKYSLSIDDDKGERLQVLFESKYLPYSKRELNFKFIHDRPEASFFNLVLTDEEGNQVSTERIVNQ